MAKLRPHLQAGRLEAGTDEVGRGCLAGPVVAAAVILKPRKRHPLLDDSKKMSPSARSILFDWIQDNSVSYAIAAVESSIIDEINILQASFLAMHTAIDGLSQRPEHLLVDGHLFTPYPNVSHTCVIKGDGKFRSIAAASVLAKVYRDRLMTAYAQEYPQYAWERNAGYPTKAHREGISAHGVTPLHRLSFKMS